MNAKVFILIIMLGIIFITLIILNSTQSILSASSIESIASINKVFKSVCDNMSNVAISQITNIAKEGEKLAGLSNKVKRNISSEISKISTLAQNSEAKLTSMVTKAMSMNLSSAMSVQTSPSSQLADIFISSMCIVNIPQSIEYMMQVISKTLMIKTIMEPIHDVTSSLSKLVDIIEDVSVAEITNGISDIGDKIENIANIDGETSEITDKITEIATDFSGTFIADIVDEIDGMIKSPVDMITPAITELGSISGDLTDVKSAINNIENDLVTADGYLNDMIPSLDTISSGLISIVESIATAVRSSASARSDPSIIINGIVRLIDDYQTKTEELNTDIASLHTYMYKNAQKIDIINTNMNIIYTNDITQSNDVYNFVSLSMDISGACFAILEDVSAINDLNISINGLLVELYGTDSSGNINTTLTISEINAKIVGETQDITDVVNGINDINDYINTIENDINSISTANTIIYNKLELLITGYEEGEDDGTTDTLNSGQTYNEAIDTHVVASVAISDADAAMFEQGVTDAIAEITATIDLLTLIQDTYNEIYIYSSVENDTDIMYKLITCNTNVYSDIKLLIEVYTGAALESGDIVKFIMKIIVNAFETTEEFSSKIYSLIEGVFDGANACKTFFGDIKFDYVPCVKKKCGKILWHKVCIYYPSLCTEYFELCHTKDNDILCRDGWKSINDVKIGEQIVTHENTYESIIDIKRSKKDMVMLFDKSTANHPRLDEEGDLFCYMLPEQNYLGMKEESPEGCEVEFMKDTELITITLKGPINTYKLRTKNGKQSTFRDPSPKLDKTPCTSIIIHKLFNVISIDEFTENFIEIFNFVTKYLSHYIPININKQQSIKSVNEDLNITIMYLNNKEAIEKSLEFRHDDYIIYNLFQMLYNNVFMMEKYVSYDELIDIDFTGILPIKSDNE